MVFHSLAERVIGAAACHGFALGQRALNRGFRRGFRIVVYGDLSMALHRGEENHGGYKICVEMVFHWCGMRFEVWGCGVYVSPVACDRCVGM